MITETGQAMRCGLFIFIFGAVVFSGCSSPTNEEAQLRQGLGELVQAIENRQRSDVMDFLHPEFKAQGELSGREVNQLMLYHFRQNKTIQVFISEEKTDLNLPLADISANILLLGTSRVLPERGQTYAVQMRWRFEDERWQLQRVNWQIR